MARFFWIASYPKSGNTWVRLLIERLLGQAVTGDDPFASTTGRCDLIASSRALFDDLVGAPSSLMRPDEITASRPGAFRALAAISPLPLFIKVHDAFATDWAGQEPAAYCQGALYILRDPRDVAASMAAHFDMDLDAAIAAMAEPSMEISVAGFRGARQFPQRLGTWSEHVVSWVDQDRVPSLMIRYEDLSTRPVETLACVADRLGLPTETEALEEAVAAMQFDRLARAEAEAGFHGRRGSAAPFFRQGRAGSWREALSPTQAARIEAAHSEVMRRFDYESQFVTS